MIFNIFIQLNVIIIPLLISKEINATRKHELLRDYLWVDFR